MLSGLFYAYNEPSKLDTTSYKNSGISAIAFSVYTHGCCSSKLSVICLPTCSKHASEYWRLKIMFSYNSYLSVSLV